MILFITFLTFLCITLTYLHCNCPIVLIFLSKLVIFCLWIVVPTSSGGTLQWCTVATWSVLLTEITTFNPTTKHSTILTHQILTYIHVIYKSNPSLIIITFQSNSEFWNIFSYEFQEWLHESFYTNLFQSFQIHEFVWPIGHTRLPPFIAEP